jgi:hypothetical protein
VPPIYDFVQKLMEEPTITRHIGPRSSPNKRIKQSILNKIDLSPIWLTQQPLIKEINKKKHLGGVSDKSLELKNLFSLWSQVRALWLLI